MRLTLKEPSECGMFCPGWQKWHKMLCPGARQFVENHFADTTIGCMRLLVDATFRRVRHLVEKNSQVRHSVEIVTSLFFDQTSYSAEHCIYQMSKRKNQKSPDVQIIKARSINFIKLLQS